VPRRSRVLEYFEQQAQERERVAIAEAEASQQPQEDGAAPEEKAGEGGEKKDESSPNSTLLSDFLALIMKAVTQWLAK
jgi:TATA-binding protein-associated factor Taf7